MEKIKSLSEGDFINTAQNAAQKLGVECKMVLHGAKNIYEIDPKWWLKY